MTAQFLHNYSYVNPDRVFTYLQDQGHGWLSVPIKYLLAACSDAELQQISCFSYYKGKSVYLEEDCDMQIFVNSWRQPTLNTWRNNGASLEFKHKQNYTEKSPVRNFARIDKQFISELIEQRGWV